MPDGGFQRIRLVTKDLPNGLSQIESITIDGSIALLEPANSDRHSFDQIYESNVLQQDAALKIAMRERNYFCAQQNREVTLSALDA